MRHRVSYFFLWAAILVLTVGPVALGQEEPPQPEPRLPPVQPFLGSPGARPLALGGAFIAVADDATAAEANPAGLTILTRPEVSLHLISQSLDREECEPCSSDSSIRPNFASYVQPMGRATFSIYYSSGLDTSSTFNFAFDERNSFEERTETNFRRVGVAGAFRPMPMLSVGASVGLNRLAIDNRFQGVFDFEVEDSDGNIIPGLFEYDDSQDTDENAVSWNLGVVVNPAGRFSAGAVYKRGADFKGRDTLRDRICFECTLAQLRALPFTDSPGAGFKIESPALWGAGVAVRPFPRALLALDYSTQKSQAGLISDEKQEIRAWRIGGEYVFVTPNPNLFIPIRAGYAREKDSDFATSDFLREKATTYSFGAGLVFGPNQIDVAFSRGYTITGNEKIRQIIVSGIRRF